MIRATDLLPGSVYSFPGGLRLVVKVGYMLNAWGDDRFYGVMWRAVGSQALGIPGGRSHVEAFCANGAMIEEKIYA